MDHDKAMNIVSNVVAWAGGERPTLRQVEIWPTYRCNLKCQFCGAWRDDPHELRAQELSDEQLREIVRECLDLGAERISFSGGGEPWLRGKLLLELMELVIASGGGGHLITNGTLMSAQDAQRIAEMGWSSVTFSIDGASASVHDQLRGKEGAWELSINALRTMIRERKGESPRIGINQVINRQNMHLIPEMVRFAAEEGCDEMMFQSVMDNTPECRDLMLTSDEWVPFRKKVLEGIRIAEQLELRTNLAEFNHEKLVDRAKETDRILEVEIQSGNDQKESDNELYSRDNGRYNGIPCFEAWQGLSITPDGRISTCGPLSARSDMRYPEISCQEAWVGSKAEGIRKMMDSGEIHGHCRGCCSTKIFEHREIRERLRVELGEEVLVRI